MSEKSAALRFCKIAGIRTIWTESDGPFTACITFRVGRSDESFREGGITHFVEHMALTGPIQSDEVNRNGAVDGTTTAFWASGDRDKVLAHIERVAASLVRLPVDRIETERRILLAEMEQWAPRALGLLAEYRFGAVGHGLIGHQQYGLRTLSGGRLQSWSHHWFTKQNAVLVFQGTPPTNLRLPLPDGAPIRPVAPRPIPWRTYPSECPYGQDGLVAVSMLAARTYAGAAAGRILQDRMMKRLRHDAGLSYNPAVDWLPLDAEHAHLSLFADARDAAGISMARDLIEEICLDLAEQGPTDDEVATVRKPFEDSADPKQIAAFWASRTAHAALFGMSLESLTGYEAAMKRLVGSQIRDTFADVVGTRLVTIPGGVRRGPLPTFAWSSPQRVSGKVYRPKNRNERATASVTTSQDGLTLDSPHGQFTVVFADCVGVLSWHDGTRAVFDRDGTYVEVNPNAWKGGDEVIALIDDRVARGKVVPMDTEVVERARHVEEVTSGSVKRGMLTKNGLDLLPHALQDGESVLAAAAASVKRLHGVLAVTDWRLIFIATRQQFTILQRADILGIDVKKGSQFLGTEGRVIVSTADGLTHEFKLGSKPGPVAAISAALERQAAAARR